MKLILRNNTAINCGTAYRIRGDVDAEIDGNRAIGCGRAYDFSDEAEPNSKPKQKEQTDLHETPAGIVTLNIASMLTGTAIGSVLGL